MEGGCIEFLDVVQVVNYIWNPLLVEETEAQIIERSRQGDEQAFAELVLRHQARVFSLLMRQLANRTTAHELAQEVFVRIFRGLPKFRGESSFSTWSTRIALNVLNSHYASAEQRTQRRTISLSDELGHAETHSGPVQDIDAAVNRLRQVVAELPEIYRTAITLTSFESKSYEEAAEILEVPVGTIRSRLNQARKLLRAALKEY